MPAHSSIPHLVRSRWAAIGAAVAVTLGAGGLVGVSASPDTATALTPITPVRILDTRAGERVGSLDVAGASDPVRFRIAGAPDSGIPATGVTGVSLNITAVDTRANDFGGYLTAYPCASTSSPRPDVSNLNFTSGQTLANAVTVPTSTDGHICIYVYGTAHVLVDANGYYTELDPPTTIDAYTTDETDTLLATKADQTDLDALAGNMVAKADLDALETLSGAVSGKADQSDLDSLATTVSGKADGGSLRPAHPSMPRTVIDTDLDGSDLDMTIGIDGYPLIAYTDGASKSLFVAACTSIDCSGTPTVSTIDTSGGGYATIEVGRDGLPLIAFTDTVDFSLRVAACSTPDCSGEVTVTRLEQIVNAGSYASLAIGVDGLPIIAYYVGATNTVRVVTCLTPDCAGPTSTANLVTGQNAGPLDLAIGVDGNPVITFVSLAGSIRVVACSTIDCSGTPTVSTIDANMNNFGPVIAIGVDGLPIISWTNFTSGNLNTVACTTSDCSTIAATGAVVSHLNFMPLDILIGDDGAPIIIAADGGLTPQIVRCLDRHCSNSATIAVAHTGDMEGAALTIGIDGTPVLALLLQVDVDRGRVSFASLWWSTGGR